MKDFSVTEFLCYSKYILYLIRTSRNTAVKVYHDGLISFTQGKHQARNLCQHTNYNISNSSGPKICCVSSLYYLGTHQGNPKGRVRTNLSNWGCPGCISIGKTSPDPFLAYYNRLITTGISYSGEYILENFSIKVFILHLTINEV